MPAGFGYGDRFKKDKKPETPGPGAYDPKDQLGFKADPKSGFLGGERFSSQDLEQSTGSERPPTPPRQRQIVSPGANRKFSWAAQRIHELQEELAQVTVKCKELEEVAGSYQNMVDDLNISIDTARNELEELKSKMQQREKQQAELLRNFAESHAAQNAAEGKLALQAATSEALLQQLQAAIQAKQLLEDQLQEFTAGSLQQQTDSAAHIEGLRLQVQNCESKLAQSNETLSATEQALLKATARCDDLQIQFDHSAGQVVVLQSQLHLLNAQLITKCEALTMAEQQISESSQQLSLVSVALAQRDSSLQSTTHRVESLEAALKSTQMHLDEAHCSISELQAQVRLLLGHETSLKQQVACLAADVQDEIAHGLENLELSKYATTDVESVLGEVFGLGSWVKSTMVQLDDLHRHHSEVSTVLQQKTCEVQQLQDKLQNTRQDLIKQGELVRQLMDNRGELQSQLEHLHSEYSQMQVDMVNENMKTKQLAIELASSKALLRSALEESSTQREEIDALVADIDKLKAEVGNKHMMQAEMDNMRNELVEAYQQVSRAQAREQQLDEQVVMMKRELAEVQLSNASVDQQVHVLQQLLEAERHRADEAWQHAKEAEAKAEDTQTAVLEMHRLMDDNELLTGRLVQMEIDLKELLCSSGTGNLGHNNPKQKIQYHLKLKQELEELRSKCTWLLREKFHLEQCVRYLSVRARLVEDRTPVMGGRERKASELVLPDSLAPTHLTATPLGQRAMKAGARSRNSTFSHQTREQLEEQINSTRKQVAKDLEAWKNGVDMMANEVSSPVIGTAHCPSPVRSPAASPRSIIRSTTAELTPDLKSGDSTIEQRILARVASVMSPVVKPIGGTCSGQNSRSNSFIIRDESFSARHRHAASVASEGGEDIASGKDASCSEKDSIINDKESMCSPTLPKGSSSRIPKAPLGVKV